MEREGPGPLVRSPPRHRGRHVGDPAPSGPRSVERALAPGRHRRRRSGAAAAAGAELVTAQQRVEISGQADVGIVSVPGRTPYSVDCPTSPVLAAWAGLARTLGSHTGTGLVREGAR